MTNVFWLIVAVLWVAALPILFWGTIIAAWFVLPTPAAFVFTGACVIAAVLCDAVVAATH